MSEFAWIEPKWKEERELERLDPDYVGKWPFSYDPFLAAVRFITAGDKDYHWEYYVLMWAEAGLEYAWTGESWDIASQDDIEWIAKIPGPTEAMRERVTNNVQEMSSAALESGASEEVI